WTVSPGHLLAADGRASDKLRGRRYIALRSPSFGGRRGALEVLPRGAACRARRPPGGRPGRTARRLRRAGSDGIRVGAGLWRASRGPTRLPAPALASPIARAPPAEVAPRQAAACAGTRLNSPDSVAGVGAGPSRGGPAPARGGGG